MSRLPTGSRRFIAVGVPALLLAVLVGCGRQEVPVAQNEPAQTPKEASQNASPGSESDK